MISHLLLFFTAFTQNFHVIGNILQDSKVAFGKDMATLGVWGILLIVMRAYSLGGGTYTGIEAVSNGTQVMRDPKIKTGKKTMLYMGTSLALTAGGLIFIYLLLGIHPANGMTMNAVLANQVFGGWSFGYLIALITIFSEGALLFVAAQTGFIDAPRVMANMALDYWLPRRFAALSNRLTMKNGIILIGISSIVLLLISKGLVSALVIMYSINVFITFSLSLLGMFIFYLNKKQKERNRNLFVFGMGLILCVSILCGTIFEKFFEGGWLTIMITSVLICLCLLIKRHYSKVAIGVKSLPTPLPTLKPINIETMSQPIDVNAKTAIQLVSSFDGFGLTTFNSIIKAFPGLYQNFLFISVGVVDQGVFKGEDSIQMLRTMIIESLCKYTQYAKNYGFKSDYEYILGTDVVDSAIELCKKIQIKYSDITVFSGQLSFSLERVYHRILHNETAFDIQKRLQTLAITNVIMPIYVDIK